MKRFLILCIVSLLLSCNNDPMNEQINPLVGTWEDTWESQDSDLCKDQFIFSTDNKVTRNLQDFLYSSTQGHSSKEPYNENLHGTYQCDNSVITIVWESGNFNDRPVESPINFVVDYSIKGNVLTMTFPTKSTFTYKKIK